MTRRPLPVRHPGAADGNERSSPSTTFPQVARNLLKLPRAIARVAPDEAPAGAGASSGLRGHSAMENSAHRDRRLMKQSHGSASKPGGAKNDARKFAHFNRGIAVKANAAAESAFVRDEAYEATPGVGQALAAIDACTPAVLIAGRAGTGKTRLVQYIKSRPGGELQATA